MLDIVEQLFGSRDVYVILNIQSSDARDPRKLRAAYLRAALVYHPDKAALIDKESSTQKFQILTKIYEVLKDDEQRKLFEETGTWPDDDSMDLDPSVFTRLNEATILDFKKYYLGSDEEMNDIKNLYVKHSGNVIKVLENLFFASCLEEDFERVEAIVANLIAQGDLVEIPPTNPKAYQASKKRKIAKAKKEAVEAEEVLVTIQKNGRRITTRLNSEADLVGAILARRESSGRSFLDNLEAKYSAMEQSASVKPPSRKRQRNE